MKNFPNIFSKCSDSTEARNVGELKRLNGYPFFPEFEPDSSLPPFEMRLAGRTVLNFGSNDYLGLSKDARVIHAAKDAASRGGSATNGSRLMNGTTSLHVELEARLAAHFKKERALLFSTGYQTNLAALSVLAGTGDVIVSDEYCHASILDGVRLSYARKLRFRHNDPAMLERALGNCTADEGRLVCLEGVYSASGDTAPLPELLPIMKKHGAGLYLDDAHGVGVLGDGGRGTAESYGVEGAVDVLSATFSKAFASCGGFIAGKSEVLDYVAHYATPFVYSASMPPSTVAAALASLEIIREEKERREYLLTLAVDAREKLEAAGFRVLPGIAPAIVVVLGEDLGERVNSIVLGQFCRELLRRGFYVNPVMGHAVPLPVVRINIMAVHELKHIEAFIAAMCETREAVLTPETKLSAANG